MSYGSSTRGRFCSPSLSPSLHHFLSFIMCGVSWQELIIPGQASRDPASSPIQFPPSPRWSLTHHLAVSLSVQLPSEVRGQLLVGPVATASSCSSVLWRTGYCLSSGSLILEDSSRVFHTLWITFTALLWKPRVSPGSSSWLAHLMTWNFSKSLNSVFLHLWS